MDPVGRNPHFNYLQMGLCFLCMMQLCFRLYSQHVKKKITIYFFRPGTTNS